MNTLPDFCEVLDTDYGKIVVNKNDTAQTGFYRHRRTAINHEELVRIEKIIRERCDIQDSMSRRPMSYEYSLIDVGANIGTWGLYFSRINALHSIFMYEAMPVFYNMLQETKKLNPAIQQKLELFRLAVGEKSGTEIALPEFDWNIPTNFGGIEIGDGVQHEFIGQTPTKGKGTIPVVSLDEHLLPRLKYPPVFLKIDVEGMEEQVLAGATQLIHSYRPILFVEFIKSDQEKLMRFFNDRNYTVEKWHTDFMCFPN